MEYAFNQGDLSPRIHTQRLRGRNPKASGPNPLFATLFFL
jgi:hypothetical protein